MTLEELIKRYPDAEPYLRGLPEGIRNRYTIRTFPPGYIIHQKQTRLDYFGIVCSGQHRVINEFENGNVFMIEKNDAVDFIGEVTILAEMEETSVTIETITECVVFMISRKDFEEWIRRDIEFLRLVSKKVAFKLYRSSYNQGAKLFYPPGFLLMEYLLKYGKEKDIHKYGMVTVKKTRQDIYEELGMTVKTINRTVQKLKDEGLISIQKGKITMTVEQYERGRQELVTYLK